MAAKPALDESVDDFLLELLDNYGYGASAGESDELVECNVHERVGGVEDVDSATLWTNKGRSVELDGLPITSVSRAIVSSGNETSIRLDIVITPSLAPGPLSAGVCRGRRGRRQ